VSKRALGKGLGALLGDTKLSPQATEPGVEPVVRLGDREARFVKIRDLKMNPHQPRKFINDNNLKELSDSIRISGVLQPVLVRQLKDGLELVAGERRVRASAMAGLEEVPALICTLEEAESMKVALLENIQREDLNAIEEAEAYRDIMEHLGATHQELADMLGRNRSTVSNMLRLLQLEQSIRDKVVEGVLTMGHARALLGVDDAKTRLRLARAVEKEGWSVRVLEEKVQGDTPRAKKSARVPARDPEAPALREYESRVFERLGSPCKILRKGQRGKIQIEFFSNDELERVLESMGISSQL